MPAAAAATEESPAAAGGEGTKHFDPPPRQGVEAAGASRGRAFLRAATGEALGDDGTGEASAAVGTADKNAPSFEEGSEGRLIAGRAASVGAGARRKDHRETAHERASSVPPIPVATVVWAAARFKRNAQKKLQLKGVAALARSTEAGPSEKTAAQDTNNEADGPCFPLTTVAMALVRFARPLAVSGRRLWQVLPSEKKLASDARRQLRLVVAGLMGSGKSTLCRMLAHLLGGVWVNQDEFAHLGKGAKRAFLQEIERESQDSKIPVLICDKINTMRQHRREILDAMQNGVAGDVVFVQLAHPRDPPDRLDNMVQLCLSRIQSRGEGHRTLHPSNPKLKSILRMTAGGLEPLGPDEMRRLSGRISVDVTQSPSQSVVKVLADLDKHNLLGRLHLDELVSKERLDEALKATKRAEEQMAAPKQSVSKPVGSAKPRKGKVWYWSIDFDSEALSMLRALSNEMMKNGGSGFEPPADLHVTLLYVANYSDADLLARHPHLKDAAAVRQLREHLEKQEGQDVQLEISTIFWDDRIAAGEVRGLGSFCANLYPHVTLAHRPGVPPRKSNELLARKAANGDLEALQPWLAELGIAEYHDHIRGWCAETGAGSADEVASSGAKVAAYLQERGAAASDERRDAVRQVLSHAAPGAVRQSGVSPFRAPLQLRGKLRGRRRGE
eukprot:TRINITY_DN27805_c0_g1_i1.p1 TRINITY_DN27805_c0_g1~~TRINITY_DN27805_c0_g1_i1.p1  ORF type:complete len:672 (+),score=147.72 TRINITY_DN27805_c0_g1_i1:92-2107(+)